QVRKRSSERQNSAALHSPSFSQCFSHALLIDIPQDSVNGTVDSLNGTVGQSVLLSVTYKLQGPFDFPLAIQWNFSNTTNVLVTYTGTNFSVSAEGIPTCHSGYVFIHPSYQGRIIFFPENASLLLQNLRLIDGGVYTVNFRLLKKTRNIALTVSPVSRPQVWSNSLRVQSAIKLFCDVSEGRVDTIVWKKDGKPLPQERDFRLSKNLRILNIPEGQKSDCGSYSCNVSNEISWQESSLNLTILSSPQKPGHSFSSTLWPSCQFKFTFFSKNKMWTIEPFLCHWQGSEFKAGPALTFLLPQAKKKECCSPVTPPPPRAPPKPPPPRALPRPSTPPRALCCPSPPSTPPSAARPKQTKKALQRHPRHPTPRCCPKHMLGRLVSGAGPGSKGLTGPQAVAERAAKLFRAA
uniref:Ig-like domain-containing protein n=1 Tax=Gopherus evgoodei TaxID=1825980 RepID=A0A8C4Y335_9SAUR